MPVHDWSPVEPNLFHHFHQMWSMAICNRLNAGLLPKGFSALVEQHAAGVVLASRSNRITIRHPLGEVVSVIEVLSPGNKSSRSAMRSFVDKTVEFLRQGIHVLVIDLLRPTSRDPQGIHKVIWDEFQEEPFALPADTPFTLVAYVASLPKVAYIEFAGVGDALPNMPVYLDLDSYVPLPLEATYASAWANCPEEMRTFVEHAGD